MTAHRSEQIDIDSTPYYHVIEGNRAVLLRVLREPKKIDVEQFIPLNEHYIVLS